VGLLGERIATVLRERIVRGEIPRGAHLVEESLAEEFDVSRGPIRDALRSLAAQGLLETKRQGVFVRGLLEADVNELYSLRTAIELLALRLAIESDGSWAGVEPELANMSAAADAGNWGEFAEHDLAFHDAFYKLSGHSRLQSTWDQYRPTFSVMLKLTNERDVDLHPSAEDHRQLLAHARSGDVEGAVGILDAHLEGSRQRMIDALHDR